MWLTVTHCDSVWLSVTDVASFISISEIVVDWKQAFSPSTMVAKAKVWDLWLAATCNNVSDIIPSVMLCRTTFYLHDLKKPILTRQEYRVEVVKLSLTKSIKQWAVDQMCVSKSQHRKLWKNSQTLSTPFAPFYLPTGEHEHVPISQFPGPGPDGTKADCLKNRSTKILKQNPDRHCQNHNQPIPTVCRLPRLDHDHAIVIWFKLPGAHRESPSFHQD